MLVKTAATLLLQRIKKIDELDSFDNLEVPQVWTGCDRLAVPCGFS